MKKVIYIIFSLYLLELCCPYCLYKNLHLNHKILDIDDEESLKKENITIENSTQEFNLNVEKLTKLKDLTEKEMTEIDKTYDKVNEETTKSFEAKRVKLKKEEDDLKEKLKTEVTKIKEQLEINLSEINNLLKSCEKIGKGIKSLEKEEKIMTKTISYVSKINKNKKEMRILFQQLMKNLKISFIEDQNAIKYEEYYFNGIPTPKNIEFKGVGSNSFKIFWKIDEINILNIDKKEIKYRIEIRKENSKDEFAKKYEGNENNYLVSDKIEKNTTYEIRICSIYKDIISNWSDIHKIKTKNLDCLILNGLEKENEYLQKLYEWTGYKGMELIYRGTRDGSDCNSFHNKCDNQGPTIVLCKNEKGNIFGGYASISWTSDNNYHNADESFVFTLTNIHGTAPTKYTDKKYPQYAVYHGNDRGPSFGGGHDIGICNNFLNVNSYSSLGRSYQDVLGKGYSIFSGDANTGNFKVKELEVFKLFK